MRISVKDLSNYKSEHPDSEKFDKFLSNYQEDIKRIVGKFRKNFHALTPEELLSESNNHLLKYKNKILNSFDDGYDFTEQEFKKIAYHYVKNLISWSHYSEVNENYNAKRLDSIHESEDGPKTTFEVSLETKGEEDKFFEDFDSLLSMKNFFHILMNYSYLLSETESKILSLLRKGLTQDEIAENLKVTHQAVSHGFISMKEKLNAFFDFNEIFEYSVDEFQNGEKALDKIFVSSKPIIKDSDKKKIKDFVLAYPKQFTTSEISKKLFQGKFSSSQISSILRSFKLNFLALKKKKHKLVVDNPLKKEALKLFEQGRDAKYVSKKLGIKISIASSMRGFFTKKGLIDSISKPKFNKLDSEKILSLFKKGKTTEEISEILNFSRQSIKGLRSSFVAKKILSSKN